MDPSAIFRRPNLEMGTFPNTLILYLCLCCCLGYYAGCSRPVEVERSPYPLPKDVDIAESTPGKYGGVFVLALSQEPNSFNFLIPTNDAYTSQVLSGLFNGLVDYDPIKEKHVPALAKSWEIAEDKRSYTFHLRRGLKWSDGELLTADDVIFTFDAIFDPRYGNRYAQQYTIAGKPIQYEKLDDYTVRFTTADIYAPFINDIGWAKILPRHKLRTAFEDGSLLKQWSTQTAIDNPADIVGTGMFRIFSYRPGERLVLSPNPHYWRVDRIGQRLPYVDFLIYKFVTDANTQTVLFATGQTDATAVSATDVVWVQKGAQKYDFTIHERGPDSGIGFIWFNQNPGQDEQGIPYVAPHKLAWFQNKWFRQAIAYGFDREGIIQAVYFGRAEPLHSIISPANRKWHNGATPRYTYDPQKARALLSEAGFTHRSDGRLEDALGNPVEFELLASEGRQQTTASATTFVENMKTLGITVQLVHIDFGTLVEKIDSTYKYEAAMMGFTGGGDPSGGKAIYRSEGHLHVWHPKQKMPATPWEARVDAIMDAQERTLDEAQRIGWIKEMQTIFAEQLPLILLVTPTTYSGIKNKWQNVKIAPMSSILWNLDELWSEKG